MKIHDVGTDHCRVVPVDADSSTAQRIAFCRHLFAYVAATTWMSLETRVLEIGVGEGYGSHYLKTHGYTVQGIDLSLQTLKHAASAYPGITYLQALGTDLPFATHSFDIVVSFQVIEHIDDVSAYVREIQRILKPTGHFLLTTPNRAWRLLPFQKPWNPYHIREYSSATLRRVLRRCFHDVQIRGVMAPPLIMALERQRVHQHPVLVYGAMVKRLLTTVIPRSWLKTRGIATQIQRRTESGSDLGERTPSLAVEDFSLSTDSDQGMDLFAIATKPRRLGSRLTGIQR